MGRMGPMIMWTRGQGDYGWDNGTAAPCPLHPAPRVQGQLLLDGTMGRIGRMGPMIMGLWDEGTILWGTMGQWDGTPKKAFQKTRSLRIVARIF